MKYHEKPAHFRELFSNLLPILLALFIWTNPILAQNNEELITLSLKNKTIGEALETINKRYNYTFVLRTPDIDTKRKVSIDVKQQKIENVLNNLFRGQDVSFDINNKTVRISKTVRQQDTEPTQAATVRSVTGQVTDISGEPMIGVSVMVKGSSNGVVTNIDGKYELKVGHPNEVLQYSFLGYLSQEKRIGDNRVLNVTLEEDVKKLDEVVVVGYSVQKKKDITALYLPSWQRILKTFPLMTSVRRLPDVLRECRLSPLRENRTKVSLFVSGERRLSMRETNLCTWWMECRPVTRKPLTLPK